MLAPLRVSAQTPAEPADATVADGKGATSEDAAFYSMPRRAGRGDGSDWDNAMPFRQAGRLAARAGPGQTVRLGVGDDDLPQEWTGQQLLWDAGGNEDAPLRLEFGAVAPDGAFRLLDRGAEPPLLRMSGNETSDSERPDVGGAPFVVLGPRASNVSVAGPSFDRAGGGGFFNLNAGGVLRGLTFMDIHARNAGRVIETHEETSVEDLLVERCSALGLIRGFARFHSLSRAEFRNLDLDANLIDGGGGAVCQIISVVSGEDLIFRDLRLARAVNIEGADERGSPYIQGDGLVLEEETRRVRIEACHAEDMGDGGFDLKSESVYMADCSATRCKLGIRIWSHSADNLIERCTITEPVSRPDNEGSCLWVAGLLTARNCMLHSTGDMPPIRFGSGPDGVDDAALKIEGGEITMSEGVSLATGAAGDLELENVLVNGVETSGRYRWTGSRLRRVWF